MEYYIIHFFVLKTLNVANINLFMLHQRHALKFLFIETII